MASTRSAPDVGRVGWSDRNVRQPDRVLADEIAGHKTERRPGTGEEWRAVTEHESKRKRLGNAPGGFFETRGVARLDFVPQWSSLAVAGRGVVRRSRPAWRAGQVRSSLDLCAARCSPYGYAPKDAFGAVVDAG